MLLTIPLCTIELTARTVKQAMEKIRSCDVDDWSQKVRLSIHAFQEESHFYTNLRATQKLQEN